MKYYIPTSSLNFNNILSSESISPISFYRSRGFGYSRWFPVEENSLNEVILLYDSPFEFERPISDIEDHPMLIELSTDESFPEFSKGVFYSDHTLYLTPWICKFIFFDEKHLQIALSLSDSSLETKLIRLYRKRFEVNHFDSANHPEPIDPAQITKIKTADGHIIQDDIRLNKMKGLLYGYYIGALLSTSEDVIERLRVLRGIQNIFAAVLSSPDRSISASQKERLMQLFSQMDKQQPLYKKLLEIVGEEDRVNEIIKALKSFGHELPEFNKKNLIELLVYSVEETNPAMSWIKREIQKVESSSKNHRSYVNPQNEEIVTSNLSLSSVQNPFVTERMLPIYLSWVNTLFSDPKYDGKINVYKEDLSDEITRIARDIIASDWEESEERTFLNHLRRHVRGEGFTLPWDNGVLSSIAAVITKGEDWIELLKFMQSKGMNDYRIPFSIYGALNGFANLSRDFTDVLLNDENPHYIVEVYKEIYGQLLGKDVDVTTQPSEPNKESEPSEPKPLAPIADPQASGETPIKYPQQSVTAMNELYKWQEMIRRVAAKYIKKDKNLLKQSLEMALQQNGEDTDNFKFLALLDNFVGWRPTKNGSPCAAWKKLQEELDPNFYERTRDESNQDKPKGLLEKIFGKKESPKDPKDKKGNRSRVQEQSKAVDDQPQLPFVDHEDRIGPTFDVRRNNRLIIFDDSAWSYIDTLITDQEIKPMLKDDWKWFIGEMRKAPNKRYRYYQDIDANNNEIVINKFCSLKMGKNTDGTDKAPYFTSELREEIKKVLMREYCDK